MAEAAIDRVIAAARQRIGPRVQVAALPTEIQRGNLIVDIRPDGQRRRHGELPEATVIDRNVLEWRLDPTSPHRLAGQDDFSRRIVIVCHEGYASSLAAASLRDLGLHDVTDLDGGFQAYRALHNPSDQPDNRRS